MILSFPTTLIFVRLTPACPTDIVRSVVTIVVGSIQYKSRRTLANVRQKFSKIVPAFTNCNPSRSVVFERDVLGVVAAIKHFTPSVVKRMFLISVPVAAAPTTARNSIARFKIAASNDTIITAIAATKPQRMFAGVSTCSSNHYQSTKMSSRDINEFGHRTAPTVRGSSGEMALARHLAAHYIRSMGVQQ